MKLYNGTIRLIDYVYTNNKEKFFDELSGFEKKSMEETEKWQKAPLAKGRRTEFSIKTIPANLEFLKAIRIILNQYQNFASSIMITIEGDLAEPSLEKIEKQNFEENNKLLEKYQKDFWNFWKTKISSTVLIKNELTTLEPITINHFKFNVEEYDELLDSIQKSIDNSEQKKSILQVLSKYATNTLGIISVLDITDQSFSILSQSRSVYRNTSLDFTGLIILDFKRTTWTSEMSYSLYKILAFQHFFYWLQIRKLQIIDFKDNLEKLSGSIKQFNRNFSGTDNHGTVMSLYEQKALFQTEYASLMDESRLLSKYAQDQLKQKHDSFFGERIIETEMMKENLPNIGLLEAFSNEIRDLVEQLKSEYDVIKEQYKILGEELSEMINFENTQASIRFAEESKKTQKTMKYQGYITLFLTGAIIALTVILVTYTLEQFNIENFEPIFNTNPAAEIVLLDPSNFQQFEYQIPIELSTLTSHHFMYTISVVKNSIKIYNYGPCFFKEIPTVTSDYTSTFFLTSNGDEIEIRPVVRLDYQSNLPHFSPEKLERSSLYSVGEVQFQIEAKDVQGTGNNEVIFVTAGLNMKLPSEYDPRQLCSNLKLK